MDLRWVVRNSVRVLQKNVFVRNDTIDEEIVAVYEWQDVPEGDE